MPQPIHFEAVEYILSAVYPSGNHRLSSFQYGKPGATSWGQFGTTIFVRRKEYIRALLFVRQNGAPYLREISISSLWSMVTDFIKENFWYVCGGNLRAPLACSYAEQITPQDKLVLADALAISVMFTPQSELTLYPLLTVRVTENFNSKHFFLLKAADLSTVQLPQGIRETKLDPTQFPPSTDQRGKKHPTTSWLGVWSPLPLVSQKMKSAILGGVALTPVPLERHLFSARKMFGGRCTINNKSWTVGYSDEPHTPPVMNDIVLTAADHGWLAILANLFEATDRHSRLQLRALEYFYRAWFLDQRERFPALCMSLDSLVGVSEKHTSAAIKFVKSVINEKINDKRLLLLMRIRGAVIHGAAPDVYDSENYEKYYIDYETDPIRDLELIVAKCLRETIFGATLKYHPDPNADLLARLQAEGKLSADPDEGIIIPDNI